MKSLITLAIVALIVGICIYYPENVDDILILGFHILVIWVIIRVFFYNPIIEKRQAAKLKDYRDYLIRSNKEMGEQLVKQFNAPISKFINYSHCQYVLISEEKSLVMVNDVIFSFDQLVKCTVQDDDRQLTNTISEEKKVKSSFLFDVINTDVGRIVNAINAPKIIKSQSNTRTLHDYTIVLTLDSITNPILRINVGDDNEMMNKLKGMFDVIKHRNQKVKS